MLLADIGDEQHVRALGVELEILRRVLGQHGGREGPERLAVFHLEVELLLHARRARIAEDRARPQRTRAKLHAALEPAERLALSHCFRTGADELTIVQCFEHGARGVQPALDLVVRELRPEVAAAHAVHGAIDVAAFFVEQVVSHERGTQRAAGIARRGLQPQPLEAAVAQELAVRHAVERHTAGEAQVLLPRLLGDAAREFEDHFFGHRLDRGREIHLALC